ncbi:recombinase family protein [Enterobacter kobei]|uniref:recombinase family protein n=1 Tax=Enterobacter kobei TaxID=208224 RepID=UPI00214A473C|nr:recombinase family protein [Enterobacter kobei]MCR2796208.1 recombinase family protein [Enterobacter kobei]
MIYGYARVSTAHQDTEFQLIALRAVGCEEIFQEVISGRRKRRPVLQKLIDKLQPGDELVLWKIDRIGRNVLYALLWLQELQSKGVNLRSITDAVDMRTASGRYNFRNILNVAQYESNLISERTLAGLAAARAKGRVGGRRPKFSEKDWSEMEAMLNKGIGRKEIALQFSVAMCTLYKKFPVTK